MGDGGGTQDFLDGEGQASMGGQGSDGGGSPPYWVTLTSMHLCYATNIPSKEIRFSYWKGFQVFVQCLPVNQHTNISSYLTQT